MMQDKDSVVGLLERLERVLREVKGLPDEIKDRMALNAGCLVTDLDELEGLVEQAKDCVNDNLHDGDDWYSESELADYGYIHESEINCKDNFKVVLEAVKDLHRADPEDQEKLIMEVFRTTVDSFKSAVVGTRILRTQR